MIKTMNFLSKLKEFYQKYYLILKKPILEFFKDKNLVIIIACLFITWISLSFIIMEYRPSEKFEIGKPAKRDVKANYNFSDVDEVATEIARKKAAESVPIVMTTEPSITNSVMSDFHQTLTMLANVKKKKEKLEDITNVHPETSFNIFIKESIFDKLLDMDDVTFNSVTDIALNLLYNTMSMGVSASPKNYSLVSDESINELKKNVDELKVTEDEKEIIFSLLSSTIRPNMKQDWAEIKKRQQEAMSKVSPIMIFITKGQTIIREGDIVTPKDLDILSDMDIYNSSPMRDVISSFIISLILVSILYYGANILYSPMIKDGITLSIVCSIIILTALICRLSLNSDTAYISGKYISTYFAPIAMASIAIQLIYDSNAAFIVTFVLCIISGIISRNFSTIVVSFITGFSSVILFAKIQKRSQMVTASACVMFINIITAVVMNTYIEVSDTRFFTPIFIAGSNAFVSCIFAIGLVFLLENLSSIVTNIKLLDLANPSEPLLKELTTKAPGSHVHCILVSNLAEAGAMAIGANPILAKVGAYYHDIGKTKQPSMFIENQFGALNPHDKVTSNLSKVIIISHVRQGVELAKKAKLPDPIVDIIAQHHGTSLLKYFYAKALKTDKNIREENFRYPGPKPQTKEAAVVMMSDCIEAAVRSLKKPDAYKIESMINMLINGMLNDGQFNECELTFKDIDTLKKVFLKSMTSLYHTRIEYPDQKK